MLLCLQKSTFSSLSWAAYAGSAAASAENLFPLIQPWLSTRGSPSTARAAAAWLDLHAGLSHGVTKAKPWEQSWEPPGAPFVPGGVRFFFLPCLQSYVLPLFSFSSQWTTSFMHSLLPLPFLSTARRRRHWSEFSQAKEGPGPKSPMACLRSLTDKLAYIRAHQPLRLCFQRMDASVHLQ